MIDAGNYPSEALLAMNSKPPNPDGTKGHTLEGSDTMAATLWRAYLSDIGYPTGLMDERLKAGKTYMVPCQSPMTFDPRWKPPRVSDIRRPRMASEMTLAEREALVARVVNSATFRPKAHGRYAQEDARTEERLPPVARELTDAERDSMARLLNHQPMKEAAE